MAGVSGRVALVTGAGAAEGIGFAVAKALAAAGANVVLNGLGDAAAVAASIAAGGAR